jgi:hypothetical protein
VLGLKIVVVVGVTVIGKCVGLGVGVGLVWLWERLLAGRSVEVWGWIVEMFGLGLTFYYARLGKSRMQGM